MAAPQTPPAPAHPESSPLLPGSRTALAVLGLAAMVMLAASHYIADRHVVHYAPLAGAAADLRVALATSHLWLEEYLTGDPRVELQADVWDAMDHADSLARVMLDGGELASGEQVVEPLGEAHLRQRVERIRGLLGRFRDLAHTRVADVAAAGVGSRLDQTYDRVFRRLLVEASELERKVAEEMAAGRRQSVYLLGLIMVAWLLILGLAMLTLSRRRLRQRQAEAALAEREQQLRQAQKLEAVGRLAGGLAHDVNNYLGTINAQCGLVKVLHGDQPAITSLMDEVIATVGRTSSLIRRLLAFSRSQPSRPRVVDLNQLTRELGSMMRRLLSDDVDLVVELEEGLWRVEMDPSQLEQVLVNLLVNAREAMPGGGRVTVATANVRRGGEADPASPASRSGDFVALSVRDRGEGIPEAIRDKLFEPFFSTKRGLGEAAGPSSGARHSGLGLATVYGIVQEADGFIELESEVGRGTEFRVYLPRSRKPAEVTDADPGGPSPVAGALVQGEGQRSGLRILLVEDNADLRRAADAVLTAVGHRVTTAEDGRVAMDLLAATDPGFDLVVTDLVMPGPSGRRVALEALARNCGGVVLVSGYRSRVEVEDLLEKPRVRYLDKPYDPRDLIAALEGLAFVERTA